MNSTNNVFLTLVLLRTISHNLEMRRDPYGTCSRNGPMIPHLQLLVETLLLTCLNPYQLLALCWMCSSEVLWRQVLTSRWVTSGAVIICQDLFSVKLGLLHSTLAEPMDSLQSISYLIFSAIFSPERSVYNVATSALMIDLLFFFFKVRAC